MVLNVHRNHQTAVLLGARFYRPKKKTPTVLVTDAQFYPMTAFPKAPDVTGL